MEALSLSEAGDDLQLHFCCSGLVFSSYVSGNYSNSWKNKCSLFQRHTFCSRDDISVFGLSLANALKLHRDSLLLIFSTNIRPT